MNVETDQQKLQEYWLTGAMTKITTLILRLRTKIETGKKILLQKMDVTAHSVRWVLPWAGRRPLRIV